MDRHQQAAALIKLFRELNVHSLYPCASVAKWLGECGFVVEVSEDGETLHVFDTPIQSINGDWGKGIYPPHVLNAAICFFGLSGRVSTDRTGRGFAYFDLVDQVEVLLKRDEQK
jgi:hypothetical protein